MCSIKVDVAQNAVMSVIVCRDGSYAVMAERRDRYSARVGFQEDEIRSTLARGSLALPVPKGWRTLWPLIAGDELLAGDELRLRPTMFLDKAMFCFRWWFRPDFCGNAK